MERRWTRINTNDFKKGFQLHKLHKDSQNLERYKNVQLGARQLGEQVHYSRSRCCVDVHHHQEFHRSLPSNLHGGELILILLNFLSGMCNPVTR